MGEYMLGTVWLVFSCPPKPNTITGGAFSERLDLECGTLELIHDAVLGARALGLKM